MASSPPDPHPDSAPEDSGDAVEQVPSNDSDRRESVEDVPQD